MVTVDNDSTKHQQIPNLATSAISSYYHHDAAPFSNCPPFLIVLFLKALMSCISVSSAEAISSHTFRMSDSVLRIPGLITQETVCPLTLVSGLSMTWWTLWCNKDGRHLFMELD